ncbi:MAG: tRNA lysidine(34) synthetase TilS [Chthoniobacterales bacterium]
MKAHGPAFSLQPNLLAQFPPSHRHLIGLSGGRDSVALLHLLVALGYQKLVVCHLDHQLRGRSARADAQCVATIAAAANLDCEIAVTNVRDIARQTKVSIETAGRVARFAFFVSVARRRRCRTIFLAHHADDLVETALLNLFRGASPGGIAAMRSVSTHRVGRTDLTIVRPLLHVWRREIDRYIQEHDLRFREDATNAQLGATRNRIRHRILPYIEKEFRRDVRRAIWRTAEIWAAEDGILESLTSAQSLEAQLELDSLRKLPVALQRRTIHKWLQLHRTKDISFDLVESTRALLEKNAVSRINLPGDRYVRRRSGKLFIEKASPKRNTKRNPS